MCIMVNKALWRIVWVIEIKLILGYRASLEHSGLLSPEETVVSAQGWLEDT